jgi:NAD(P)-dependent dehydrogenase (short-subunit alcohol dehydrogenase family)
MSSNPDQPDRAVVLITGAATGIGAATAAEFAARGFVVVGTDVDRAAGEQVFAELGAPHRFHLLDVRDAAAWEALLKTVVAEHGRLDILHLNAGVMMRPKGAPIMDDPLDWFTADIVRKVGSVNFEGVAFGIVAGIKLPSLRRIIITASGAALMPLDIDPCYTASKYGVLGLALALEKPLAARGIRIDVICPGAIGTSLTAPDVRDAIKQERPGFIAESVVTIATSDAPGPVWMAFTEEQGLQRYEPPGLPGMAGALDVTEHV